MSSKRERRPSMAQRPVLVAIADLIERTGQPARHGDVMALIDERGERRPQVAQWCAIAESGAAWVTTDRGTEDNRGGIQAEYRYTMTESGYAAIDREQPAPPAEEPVILDDGYRWHEGVISNPKAWTLVDPDGDHIAHVYRCDDGTWRAVWNDGEVIADGFDKSGPALRAADDVARGCAWDISDPSHGPMSCGDDRAPGSPYCSAHREWDVRAQAISDDMDRLEESRRRSGGSPDVAL